MARRLRPLSLLVLCVYALPASGRDSSSLAELLLENHGLRRPIPLLSQHDPALSVPRAYAVQKTFVQRRLAADKIAGFKFGLTSAGSQRKFGIDMPLSGVLLASGKRTGSPTIDLSTFGKLMIETEIGFVVGKAIGKPLSGTSDLRSAIRGVAPVIELPDLGFADMQKLKGVDIIAANVCAAQFIVGKETALAGIDLDAVAVTLSRNGEIANRGLGAEALGDQWGAARRLANTIVQQGWQIEPGHVLITGALGKMVPGEKGDYVAVYGTLGEIRFHVR